MQVRTHLPTDASGLIEETRRIFALASLLGAIFLALLIAGCGEQPEDLGERITQMQKELERNEAELKTTKQALAKADEELTRLKAARGTTQSPAQAPQNGPVPEVSRETFEESYTTAARRLKNDLQIKLKRLTVETVTLHNVALLQEKYPVTSEISLLVRSDEGTPYQLDFNVKADNRGTWIFPDSSEIVRRLDEMRKGQAHVSGAARPSESGDPTSRAELQRPSGRVSGPPGSGDTVIIQWPGDARSGESATNPAAAIGPEAAPKQSPPAPQKTPQKGINADRDVFIQF